jgi:hypothetical protein
MRTFMNLCDREMTMRDALSDPVIRALMDADGVDPAALEADLREVAESLRSRPARAVRCADMALHA